MAIEETKSPASEVDVTTSWDSQYVAPTKAFGIYREIICATFMPWSPEADEGRSFEARVQAARFESGALARLRTTPVMSLRTKANIANSPMDGIFGTFVISGQLMVEQAGITNVARPGDFVLYDSSIPVKLQLMSEGVYEDVGFLFAKSKFTGERVGLDRFRNLLIHPGDLVGPLSSCLAFIAQNLHASSQDELLALFDACVSLLPLSVGLLGPESKSAPSANASPMLRDLLNYIDKNITNPNLSPTCAAGHIGISTRYIHKLFAQAGLTFTSYVMSQRLEHIRWELIGSGRHRPISELAYRWGFNELSTFNRAFRERYGCTPSQLRSASAR